MTFPHKIKKELPYDPAILLLGIYLKELKTGSQRDGCTPVIMAALFTTVKKSKLPKCTVTGEQIHKMWYIHTMEYYSALKRKSYHMLRHG